MKMSHIIPAGVVSMLVCLGMFAGIARAEDGPWQTDFEAAKAQAKAEKKIMLVDFTGSDWCGWCIKLKDEVFEKDAVQERSLQAIRAGRTRFPPRKETAR